MLIIREKECLILAWSKGQSTYKHIMPRKNQGPIHHEASNAYLRLPLNSFLLCW